MLPMLKQWHKNKLQQRQKQVEKLQNDEVKFLCECALNVINGKVPFQVKQLLPYEKELKVLCNPNTTNEKRRFTLKSVKGNKLLQKISRPCIQYICNNERRRIYSSSKNNVRQRKAKRVVNNK